MLSAGNSSSIEALHKVTRMEPIACRQKMLATKTEFRLQTGPATIPTCFMYQMEQHEPIVLPTHGQLRELKFESIVGMRRSEGMKESAVANAITLDLDDMNKVEAWYIPHQELPIEMRDHLMRWRIGNVAIHQDCKKCLRNGRTVEASRMHAIECSGVQERLSHLVDDTEVFQESNLNIIDYIMNMNRKNLPGDVGKTLAMAIKDLRIRCFDYNDGSVNRRGVRRRMRSGATHVAVEVPTSGNRPTQRGVLMRDRIAASRRLPVVNRAGRHQSGVRNGNGGNGSGIRDEGGGSS